MLGHWVLSSFVYFTLLCGGFAFASPALITKDLEITVKNSKFSILPPSSEFQIPALGMSLKEQQSFLEKRDLFLTLTAKSLSKLNWQLGPIVILKHKLAYNKFQSQKKKFIEEAYKYDDGSREDFLAALNRYELELEEKRLIQKSMTMRQYSEELTLLLLQALDLKLWQQAPLVAQANEFGVFLAGGPIAEGGNSEKGYGGLTNLGVSVGFNLEQKAVALQLFSDLEKFKSTQMPAVFVIGLSFKLGFYLSNFSGKLNSRGSTFYPPMIPGFTSSSPNSFATGFSSGLTIPPSPLGDLLTYTNDLNQSVLMRLTISPLTRGFVRIKSSIGKSSFNFLVIPFKKLFSGPAIRCSAIFE